MKVNGAGCNAWGNLRRKVAKRHDPNVIGLVISDFGETWWIALGETGITVCEKARDWVGVGSPAHLKAQESTP